MKQLSKFLIALMTLQAVSSCGSLPKEETFSFDNVAPDVQWHFIDNKTVMKRMDMDDPLIQMYQTETTYSKGAKTYEFDENRVRIQLWNNKKKEGYQRDYYVNFSEIAEMAQSQNKKDILEDIKDAEIRLSYYNSAGDGGCKTKDCQGIGF